MLDACIDGTGQMQHPVWDTVDFLQFARQTGLELRFVKVDEHAFTDG